MDKEKIKDTLLQKGYDELRNVLLTIIDNYCVPSFGSMSKHDADLLLFDSMVSLGIINSNPTIYDVMRDLKVTRAKARSLIYEYQLRRIENENQLRDQLREVMRYPLMSNVSKFVSLEVDNPYLVDFIRNELKNLGFVTDGSFHAELVKMSTDAFAVLYENTLTDESKKQITSKLVELGVKPDTSLTSILPHLVAGVGKTMAKAAFGKIGEDIADSCTKYVGEHIDELKQSIGELFQD